MCPASAGTGMEPGLVTRGGGRIQPQDDVVVVVSSATAVVPVEAVGAPAAVAEPGAGIMVVVAPAAWLGLETR